MSDNKNETGKKDQIRVDANDASEVEFLHQQYPAMTHQEIVDAIKSAGPMRSDIKAYLDKKK